ncbi:MAG: hypothetical protein R3195_19785 [Gemmatimonadota bacterium]|nr:hypothetical protein [Gemmatimonadota bacterium]
MKMDSMFVRSRRRVAVLGILVVAASLAACGDVPTAEIEAAHAAVEAARVAGAADYTPEAMAALDELSSQVTAELAAQDEKMPILRSYGRATELADSLEALAMSTTEQVATAREEVRVETEQLVADVRAALAEGEGLWTEAPRGKGTSVDLVALQGDLAGVRTVLTEAETALAEGRYVEARAKAQSALEATRGVNAAIRNAIEMQRRIG